MFFFCMPAFLACPVTYRNASNDVARWGDCRMGTCTGAEHNDSRGHCAFEGKRGSGLQKLRGITMDTTDQAANGRSFGKGLGLKKSLMTLAASVMLATSAQAAVPATAEVNTTGLAVTDDTVTVGILHSITGTMAISEIGSVQAEKLAIDQINASGGVLGRQIEFVQEDGASDWPTFAEKSRKLLRQDNVAAIFGAWTSAS